MYIYVMSCHVMLALSYRRTWPLTSYLNLNLAQVGRAATLVHEKGSTGRTFSLSHGHWHCKLGQQHADN